jgi:hypothetical protein
MSSNQQIIELKGIVEQLKLSIENIVRPPEHVVLDDVDLRDYLKVCKRTTAYWREKGLITFSKLGGKIYYRLSDILAFLKQHEVSAVATTLKVGL